MMGILGSPNCGLETWTETAVGPFRPVYLDLGLIKLAENYEISNPYVVPKSSTSSSKKKNTIYCVKGKATTKVTGTNPKCPAGYSKK